MTPPISIIVELVDTHLPVRKCFKGREAWALYELIRSGSDGCTPLSHPGPRWSAYVHKLRQAGLNIATITEIHGGPYAGHHARYVLVSKIRLIPANDNEAPDV